MLLDPQHRDAGQQSDAGQQNSSPATNRRTNPRHANSSRDGSSRTNPSRGGTSRGEHGRARGGLTPLKANTTATENRQMMWLAAAVASIFIIALSFMFSGNRLDVIPINPVTLCPVDEEHITSKTYLLVDLSEPLSGDQRAGLKDLLKSATDSMATQELISVSQMQAVLKAPRHKVTQFCKPDIQRIGQAGSRIKEDDCKSVVDKSYDWYKNVGDHARKEISTTCSRYLDFKKGVNVAALPYAAVNQEQNRSYIVGSIEDIIVDADDDSSDVPTRLIVFSDMLQHAEWFSQYRTHPDDWTIENLRERRKNAIEQPKYRHMSTAPANNFKEVLLCYLPNDKMLNTSIKEKQHRQMWEGYFSDSRSTKAVEFSGCAVATEAMMKKT